MVDYENFTWKDLCEWTKKHGNESIGYDPSACWIGAHYIFDYFGLLKEGEEPEYNKEITIQELEKINGWVHCFIENDFEFHHFSLYLTEENVYLIQTYGGIKKLTKLKFGRADFFQQLSKALNGDVKAYKYIFNIPKSVKIPNNIGTSSLFIQ